MNACIEKQLMKMTALKLGLLSCLAAGSVFAGPVDYARIDAQAGWGVHVDVDRLKETQVGKRFLVELQKPEFQQKMDWFQTFFGFDPLKAVHGVTLYGGMERQEDGVLMIQGDFDTNRLEQLVKSWSEYQSTQHAGRAIHSWTDQNKAGQPRTFGAFAGGGIILSQKTGLVENAIDVIDGAKPGLNNSSPFEGLNLGDKKAVVVGGVAKIKQTGPPAVSTVIKKLKFIGAIISEDAGQLQIDLPVRANDADVAQSVGDIFRGMSGALKLQTQNPDMEMIGRAIKVTQNDSSVVVSIKMAADQFLGLVDAAKSRRLFR
jgi:hypothetical protein